MSLENPFAYTGEENTAEEVNNENVVIEHYKQRLTEIQKQREEALEKRTTGEISGVQLDEINKTLDQDSETIKKTF